MLWKIKTLLSIKILHTFKAKESFSVLQVVCYFAEAVKTRLLGIAVLRCFSTCIPACNLQCCLSELLRKGLRCLSFCSQENLRLFEHVHQLMKKTSSAEDISQWPLNAGFPRNVNFLNTNLAFFILPHIGAEISANFVLHLWRCFTKQNLAHHNIHFRLNHF